MLPRSFEIFTESFLSKTCWDVQGVPTSFRISNLREIRILKFFVKKIRQI